MSQLFAVVKPWGIAPILLAVRDKLDDATGILVLHPRAVVTTNVYLETEPVTHYRIVWGDVVYHYRGPGMPFASERLTIEPSYRAVELTKGGASCPSQS